MPNASSAPGVSDPKRVDSVQTVPERAKTEAVYDIQGFFRSVLERTDTSLIEEWENMLHPGSGLSRRAGTAAGEEALEE